MSGWDNAFQTAQPATIEDEQLYEIGKLIFERFEKIRSRLKTIDFRSISRDDLTRLFTGSANRLAYLLSFAAPLKDKTSTVSVNQLIQTAVGTMNPIDPTATPDMILTASIDSLRFPLKQKALSHVETTTKSDVDGKEVISDVIMADLLGQMYEAFDTMWMSALWKGRHIQRLGGIATLLPAYSPESLITAVSEYRRQALSLESVFHVLSVWNDLPYTFKRNILSTIPRVTLKKVGRLRQFEISGSLESDTRSLVMFHYRLFTDRDWYSPFFAAPLPASPGITIWDILRVWEVLHAISVALIRSLPEPDLERQITEIAQLTEFSPVIHRSQLSGLIKSHTSFSTSKIDEILEFLTVKADSNAELWACPLIELSPVRILILWSPVVMGNLPRTVELWMKLGRLDFQTSGYLFENYARNEIRQYISSSLVKDVDVADSALEFEINGQKEEIDLWLRVGKTVLLVEVKCVLFPSEPIEQYRYFEILKDAALQIDRKASFVKAHAEEFIVKSGISENDKSHNYSFYPVILVNQTFGSGYQFNGVPVTDLLIIQRFLDGKWERFAVMTQRGEHTALEVQKFYESDEEASDYLPRYIASPPQILEYLRFVQMKVKGMPSFGTDDVPIQIAYFDVEVPEHHLTMKYEDVPWL